MLLESVDFLEIIDGSEFGRNAAVRCEELLIQNAGQRNQVKRIHQSVVNVLIVFIQAFVSEVEERSHLSAFVIASYKGDCVWKIYFQRVQQNYHFN